MNNQQSTIIAASEHCARVSVGLVSLTVKFQCSIHINNFERTGNPFKLVNLNSTTYVLFFNWN